MMIFMVVFFLAGNENTLESMSTHCMGFVKLHFHFPSEQSWDNFASLHVIFLKGIATEHAPFNNAHHLHPWPLCILPIHVRYTSSLDEHARRKSPSCKSLKAV